MEWTGRQLFDAGGDLIGVIAGAGYARRKFGTAWLLVDMDPGRRVLVPTDQIDATGDRLVLPYPRGYVETGPTLEGDEPPTPDGERRLRLHYGVGGGNGGQCRSCGLCMTTRRAQHRQKTG
jgi:hypothetical protein